MDGHTEFHWGLLAVNLLLVLLLVFLNGVFVHAEFSLVKMRQSRLTQLQSEGHRLAGYALKVNQRLDAYLSATPIGHYAGFIGFGLDWRASNIRLPDRATHAQTRCN